MQIPYQFPTSLNNSAITDFDSCPRKFYLKHIAGYHEVRTSIDLVAGAAFAYALEAYRSTWYEQGDIEQAEATALQQLIKTYGPDNPEHAKCLPNMARLLLAYFEKHPIEQEVYLQLPSGKPAVEFSFCYPVEVKNPSTGEDILFTGTFDAIVQLDDIGLFGLDDKTASFVSEKWLAKWDMHSQFSGYAWGAAQAGYKLEGFCIRPAEIKKSGEVKSLDDLTIWKPSWIIDRWYRNILCKIKAITSYYQQGIEAFYEVEGNACNEYAQGCPFRGICPAMPAQQEDLLNTYFERKLWNPLTKQLEPFNPQP